MSSLCGEFRSRIGRRTTWQAICDRDDWFQTKVCQQLPKIVATQPKPPVVFGYSYAAKRIFELARTLGCTTVLGQIDPGPVEMRLVRELEASHGAPQTEWPPEAYWGSWREECNLADAIVVNSEWSRDALIQEGVHGNRIHTIPLAYERANCDENLCREVPYKFSATRPLRVLFLGQVIPRKGAFELAEAISILADAAVEWTVVGPGSSEQLSRLRALPNTIVTGAVSRAQATEFYRRADVFILPTHSDGFALTQLEAAAFGLPIISSMRCGDVVVNGKNGLRLPEVSGESVAAAVKRLLRAPSIVRVMSERQSQIPRLTLKQLGQRFIELTSMLNRKNT